MACCRTHTFSTVWACRKEMNEVNACLAEQYVCRPCLSMYDVLVHVSLHCADEWQHHGAAHEWGMHLADCVRPSLCSTSEAKLNELKRKWLAAGMPSNPDWDPYAQ